MLSDSAILKKIEQQPKRTAGFKQLARELGVHGDARRELFERLKHLMAGGQLQQVGPDRYAIPQAAAGKNMAVGRLSMHRDGFGFVIPEANSLDERLKAKLAGDIFIPPPVVGSAMHGDRVLVEIGNIRPDGRAEGRIVRLVGRAHSTVVGKFHYGSRRNYVTPIDQKITQEIVIPPGNGISGDSRWPMRVLLAHRGEGRMPSRQPAGRRRYLRAGRVRIACWARKRRGAPPGTTWKMSWWMSRSPTGQRPRRIRAGAWSRFWATKTISAWMSRS